MRQLKSRFVCDYLYRRDTTIYMIISCYTSLLASPIMVAKPIIMEKHCTKDSRLRKVALAKGLQVCKPRHSLELSKNAGTYKYILNILNCTPLKCDKRTNPVQIAAGATKPRNQSDIALASGHAAQWNCPSHPLCF